MRKINLPPVQHLSDFVTFSGGLDVVTPAAILPTGLIRSGQNIEEDVNGGYSTVSGYERFDGRKSPSSALYCVLSASNTGTVSVGDTITGAISGASAVVIAVETGRFILTKASGVFTAENTVSGGATVSGPALLETEIGINHAQYKNLAADRYRSDIQAVPGKGPILGVWYYKGAVYAFRNKNASTGVGMYKSTSSGWSEVSLGYWMAFENGSGTAPAPGTAINQSSFSARLTEIVVESGSFSGGNAAGRMYFSSATAGQFFSGVAFASGITATCASVMTATSISNQDGRFEFVNANFTGYAGTLKMFGVDGKNHLFQFDGDLFMPIRIGLSDGSYPQHIAAHQNHLFVSYLSSAMHSAIGDPANWITTLGAGEIAFGDNISGFKSQPGSETTAAMAVYCRNKTSMLYGSSSADWAIRDYADEVGAIPYSIQKIGETLVLDDRGVTAMSTSLNFGNFESASISIRVKPWLSAKRFHFTDSHVCRDKQQYRLFFRDGSAAYLKLGKSASITPILFPNPVLCSVSSEKYGGGEELIFFGSDNGYVYQMERGTSFDGEPIDWFFDMVFNHSKSYRALKRYRRMTLEVMADGYAEFRTKYSLGYSSSEIAQPGYTSHNSPSAINAYWDSFTWDQFDWDSSNMSPISMAIEGNGENISIRVAGYSDYANKTRFSGAMLEFSPLRMMR